MNIASLIRHSVTFLAGLGGLFLSWHIIAPEQVAAVNAAGADLIAPLTIILGAVAACVARLALAYFGKLFAGKKMVGSGWSPLVIGFAAAGLICTALPSCNPEQQAILKAFPIKACYVQDGVRICASSKSGLGIEVDQSSRK